MKHFVAVLQDPKLDVIELYLEEAFETEARRKLKRILKYKYPGSRVLTFREIRTQP